MPEPGAGGRWSLFLDFDGTLTEIADHPEAVRVPPDLPGTLAALERALGGALAIVSGRSIETIDRFLGLPDLPAAGLHGLERRWPGGETERVPAPCGALAAAREAIARFTTERPGLLGEDKGLTIALHYRAVPEQAGAATEFMQGLAARLPELQLLEGKMVLELKPRGVDKGAALRSFMTRPIFREGMPVFAGDDHTDEDGFAAAQALGGAGIKVGPGATCARYRVADVPALLAWLERLTCRVSTSE